MVHKFRRFEKRRSDKLFRGNELMRIMTMLVMLAVLAMMMRRARDTDTWRFFTGEPRPTDSSTEGETGSTAAETATKPAAVGEKGGSPEQLASSEPGAARPKAEVDGDEQRPEATPPDQDPDEVEAIRELFTALSDRSPLKKEEMAAYWRLIQWEQSQTFESMYKRARGNVSFNELLTRPAKYRGELIKLRKIHLKRVLKWGDLEDNPLGVKTTYDAYGVTDSSQAWFYFCVFTDPPPGMPMGENIYEDARFVGYFLKDILYEDGQGRKIAAPVLIGRMEWIRAPRTVTASEDEWWWSLLLGGGLAVFFLLRWGWQLSPWKRAPKVRSGVRPALNEKGEETVPIEQWLEGVESPAEAAAISPGENHEQNGNGAVNGAAPHFSEGLDEPEDRER